MGNNDKYKIVGLSIVIIGVLSFSSLKHDNILTGYELRLSKDIQMQIRIVDINYTFPILDLNLYTKRDSLGVQLEGHSDEKNRPLYKSITCVDPIRDTYYTYNAISNTSFLIRIDSILLNDARNGKKSIYKYEKKGSMISRYRIIDNHIVDTLMFYLDTTQRIIKVSGSIYSFSNKLMYTNKEMYYSSSKVIPDSIISTSKDETTDNLIHSKEIFYSNKGKIDSIYYRSDVEDFFNKNKSYRMLKVFYFDSNQLFYKGKIKSDNIESVFLVKRLNESIVSYFDRAVYFKE